MIQKIEAESAYILHTRAYLETSMIVELFTEHQGRIAVVAKGAKRPKSKGRGLLQPFVPLLVSCRGRGELLTLTDFEMKPGAGILQLQGRILMCAFYLNELLMRLIPRFVPHADLFHIYAETLGSLQTAGINRCDATLRLFEKSLLSSLGYALPLLRDCETGEPISAGKLYFFDPESGPYEYTENKERSLAGNQTAKMLILQGKTLLDLNRGILDDPKTLVEVKRLMRRAVALQLGGRPLESRRLF